jgi:hypothetical protein
MEEMDSEEVRLLLFTSQDKYFEVIEDNVHVYDNSSGSLVKMGELIKGRYTPVYGIMETGMKYNLVDLKVTCIKSLPNRQMDEC